MAGAEEALERFTVDFPDENVASVALTVDGRAAFIAIGAADWVSCGL